jgi:hypothetical protein
MEAPNVDYIYWTFTAAAQSVAAFVGLLLAGYALVHSLMESARERDESLDEIHVSLRHTFHRWLRALATVTGLAVVLSLVVVLCNRWEYPGKYVFAAVVGLIDVASIVCGLAFVVVTTHPKRYEITAERVLEKRGTELALSGESMPVGKFFSQVARMERALRRMVQAHDVFVEGPPGRAPTLRQMADALLAADKIDADLHRELVVIMQYRNLVYHGHVTTADKTMLDRVLAVVRKIDRPREGGERPPRKERDANVAAPRPPAKGGPTRA